MNFQSYTSQLNVGCLNYYNLIKLTEINNVLHTKYRKAGKRTM